MAELQGTIRETPGQIAPADLANQIAVVGHFPALNSATPQIVPVRRFGDVRPLVGRGKGADLAGFMLRIAQEVNTPATVFCVPHPATIAGSITFDGQTGFGPAATLTATDTNPYDDAVVRVRIRSAGAPGVGTFELSTAYLVTRDSDGGAPSIEPLYDAPRTIPARTAAMITGTVDLTSLTYAKPAIVTGNIDLVNTAGLYGAGGTLAGAEFDITVDAAPLVTVTFGTGANAPLSYLDVLATIDAATIGIPSVTGNGFLQIDGVALSSGGSIVLAAGSPDALAVLGLGSGTTNGTAGTLDGLTVLYEGDATSGSQTWTIPTGAGAYASADALVAGGDALTGVDVSMFSARNFMRIGSATAGSASTFEISGGTALATLGLSVGSATGAESEFVIEHLGVKVTFVNGTYSSGYERVWTTKAPSCSSTDLVNAISALVAQEIRVGRVWCASDIALGSLSAFIQAAAGKVAELEAANDARFLHAGVMAPIAEADSDVRNAFVSAVAGDASVGRRVDIACRSGYMRPAVSSPDNTGSLLRSMGWAAAAIDAAYLLGSDRGQHDFGALRYLDYVPVHEDQAQVKMGQLRDQTADPRANVAQKWGDGYYFSGGFTLAPSASAYADQYVRDIILRVAQLVHAGLKTWLNKPALPLNSQGKLTDEGAGAVASTCMSLLSLLLPQPGAQTRPPPSLLTAARVTVDQTNIIGGPGGSQRMFADCIVQVQGIARSIRFTVGAGLVT